MHIKRKTMPKFWPVARTGSKYLAVPSHNQEDSVSLILVMRDMLHIVKNKKELKKLLNEKKVMVNGKIVREINYPVCLFDSLALPLAKKYFKTNLEGKKLSLVEINEKDTHSNICKIIGKTMLSGKKVQLNLSNGRNILSSEKVEVGSFVVIDNEKNKIIKIIALNKNESVLIIKGKHTGVRGKINEIKKEGQNEIAEIKTKEGGISTNIENLFVEI